MRGGVTPGTTSKPRCSLMRCLSSAPLIRVTRLRWANCSLARPNHEVVTSTPVVALWSAMTPVRACTASSLTRLDLLLAWTRQTPPKNMFLLVATASTPPVKRKRLRTKYFPARRRLGGGERAGVESRDGRRDNKIFEAQRIRLKASANTPLSSAAR
ncbi:hypothetical protein ACTIVE_4041 [Actinomadura verrucosospora]|uniref:Uncharacterized protein n=1 Tax=Actinomadura verrucosospora TaxID=46165 RepID=A0A7D3ZKQ4_ACTVE|nr:hypothetical protein ACTIVE_4041 [Actinomadura verrucosospora]